MSDNLTIQGNKIMMAQRADLAAPWWAGMKRGDVIMQPGSFSMDAAQLATPEHVAEVRAACLLDWDAISVTPHYTLPGSTELHVAKDHRLIVRNDTGAVLGQASDGYKVHTMSELLTYMQKLMAHALGGGWRLVTIGGLSGGRVIWAQARRDESAEVLPGVEIARTLMLQTSFDGSQPTGCSDGETVIVCDNTRRANWNEAGKKATQRHRSAFDGQRLTDKAGIQTSAEGWQRNIQALRILADTPCSDGQARDILRNLLDKPAKDAKETKNKLAQPADNAASDFAALLSKPVQTLSLAPEAREHRNVAPIMALFQGQGHGAETEGYKGTRYGLLQSVTEFVDHFAGRTYDTGRMAAQFGQGDALKTRATELVIEGTPAAALFA